MKVYVILESQSQDEFTYRGNHAKASTRVVDVYASKKSAYEAAAMYRRTMLDTIMKYKNATMQYYTVVERDTVR